MKTAKNPTSARSKVKNGSMSIASAASPASLYEVDETAWLDAMAELCARKQAQALDLEHLSEYLSDMARRDRREVYSRLFVLMTHLLKWDHQPRMQTCSWRATIGHQRLELRLLLDSKALLNHARQILADVYVDARKQAATETELKLSTFPKECPWEIDDLLHD